MDSETALVLRESLPLALRTALSLWADATTDAASRRRPDLLRDKQQTIASFFSLIKKTPAEVEPTDVKLWQQEMEGKPLARSTVYNRISLLSSFYLWAMRDPQLGQSIESNPAVLARPKAPRAYQVGGNDSPDNGPFDLSLYAEAASKNTGAGGGNWRRKRRRSTARSESWSSRPTGAWN